MTLLPRDDPDYPTEELRHPFGTLDPMSVRYKVTLFLDACYEGLSGAIERQENWVPVETLVVGYQPGLTAEEALDDLIATYQDGESYKETAQEVE
jgi:hypothetical protein